MVPAVYYGGRQVLYLYFMWAFDELAIRHDLGKEQGFQLHSEAAQLKIILLDSSCWDNNAGTELEVLTVFAQLNGCCYRKVPINIRAHFLYNHILFCKAFICGLPHSLYLNTSVSTQFSSLDEFHEIFDAPLITIAQDLLELASDKPKLQPRTSFLRHHSNVDTSVVINLNLIFMASAASQWTSSRLEVGF